MVQAQGVGWGLNANAKNTNSDYTVVNSIAFGPDIPEFLVTMKPTIKSRQYGLNNISMHVGQSIVAPLMTECQTLVMDAEQV